MQPDVSMVSVTSKLLIANRMLKVYSSLEAYGRGCTPIT